MEDIIVNGVKVGQVDEAGDVADSTARSITLPSGAMATVRIGKGRDLIKVQKGADPNDPNAQDMFMFAIVAQLAKIDGKHITKEQLLDMPLADVLALQKEVVGDNFLSLIPATSQS
jgi:hypothetical protein